VVGLEEDVHGLSGGDHDVVDGERLEVAAVSANHREAMSGDGEEHVVGEPRVDDPEQVRLAVFHEHPEGVVLGARGVVAGLAIDGVGVGDVDVAAGPLALEENLLHVCIPPLAEDDGHLLVWPGVGVDRATLRVDDDGAVHGGAVEVAVRVPPQRALLLGEDDAVGQVGAGLDWALRDVLRPVGPRVPWLVHAVPMEGDVLAAALVVHVDDDNIALAGVDGRTGELPVHGQDGLLMAQPGNLRLLYLQNS